jgi:hypothetical protein
MPTLHPTRVIPLWLTLASAALLTAGCITERVSRPSRGVPVRPAGDVKAVLPGAVQSSGATSTSSQARFAVTPLGVVRYDGLTLPLISPDGRRLASQVHQPPGWPGLLATRGDDRSGLCRVVIYALGSGNAVVTDASTAVPRGVILGRHADETGFFVESPQPDGSRWIGHCDWTSGAVTWLVQKEGVCAAHAIALRDGTLIYTARETQAASAALVIAAPGKEQVKLTVPDGSLMFPLATPSQRQIAVLTVGESGLDLVFIDLQSKDPLRLGARCQISADGSAKSAFQAVASSQAAPPMSDMSGWGELSDSIAIYALRFGGAVFVSAEGEATRLERRSLSAAPVVGRQMHGALVATEQDLRYVELKFESGEITSLASTRVLSDPFVCRLAESEVPSFVALGPRQTAPEPALLVVGLALAE